MVTLPRKEKEKEKGRGREGGSDLAWTEVKRKSRNEPQSGIVELELKSFYREQKNQPQQIKLSFKHRAWLCSLSTKGRTLRVMAENLKRKLQLYHPEFTDVSDVGL